MVGAIAPVSLEMRTPAEASAPLHQSVLLSRMDRCNQLQDHLAQAQRELAEVAARIERQKALIRKLERGGQDTAHAAFLLQQSLGLKALNEAHRARLQRELESLGSSRVQAGHASSS